MLLVKHRLNPNIVGKENDFYTPGWPLRNACSEGQLNIVRVLLRHPQCDVTLTNRQHRTCLHWAAINSTAIRLVLDNLKVRGLLSDLINAKDKFSAEPLTYLVRGLDGGKAAWHYVTVKKSLLTSFARKTKGGRIDVANFGTVLRSGFGRDPDSRTKEHVSSLFNTNFDSADDNCTALHLAVEKLNVDAVEALLEYGANVNIPDSSGLTPLHYAAMLDSRQLCQLLLQYGADLEVKDTEGHTPLDVARLNDCDATARYLTGRRLGTNLIYVPQDNNNNNNSSLVIALMLDLLYNFLHCFFSCRKSTIQQTARLVQVS
jgi:ankyrin repeat protein